MAKITGITCNHVKGINHLDVPCDFYPNKPPRRVARNRPRMGDSLLNRVHFAV